MNFVVSIWWEVAAD